MPSEKTPSEKTQHVIKPCGLRRACKQHRIKRMSSKVREVIIKDVEAYLQVVDYIARTNAWCKNHRIVSAADIEKALDVITSN